MKKNIINKQDIFWASFFFAASTVITWWFIDKGKTLYFSNDKMLLSCAIAGAKWGIQIAAAFLFLAEKKWLFIKRIGFICFVGSCILLPYCFFDSIRNFDNSFLASLIIAVLVMIAIYYEVVMQTAVSTKWFWGWIACLAIAISLQLFVVFKIAG
jgi:hypothetical protein